MNRITLSLVAASFTLGCSDGANAARSLAPEDASSLTTGAGGDINCVGTRTGTFDNVTVPVGATCTLRNSTVQGNLKALENSRLFVSNTIVRGDIQGDKARIVRVTAGRVDGNIQIV